MIICHGCERWNDCGYDTRLAAIKKGKCGRRMKERADLLARVLVYKDALRRAGKRLRERIRRERFIWKDYNNAVAYHYEEVAGLRRCFIEQNQEIEKLKAELWQHKKVTP